MITGGGGGGAAPFSNDATYFLQQQAQTNALQHQFEQFNMVSAQCACAWCDCQGAL